MTKKHIPETEQQPEAPNAENGVTLSAELLSNKDEHNEVGDKGKQDSLTTQEETMKKQSEAGKADDQNTDKTDRTLTSAQIDLTKKANFGPRTPWARHSSAGFLRPSRGPRRLGLIRPGFAPAGRAPVGCGRYL